MAIFAYAPGIRMIVDSVSNGQIDISDDLVSGQIFLRENGLHTMEVGLLNKRRKYDRAFAPNDRFVIYLKRVKELLVMTGYLNRVPFLTAWQRTIALTGSCANKRLLYHFWDQGAPASYQFLSATSGGSQNTQDDGGIATQLTRVLTDVVGWDKNNIHLGNIPASWMTKVTTLYNQVETKVGNPFNTLGGGNTVGDTNPVDQIGVATRSDAPNGASLPTTFGPVTASPPDYDIQPNFGDPYYVGLQWGYRLPPDGTPNPTISAQDTAFAKTWIGGRLLVLANPNNNKGAIVHPVGWGPLASAPQTNGQSPQICISSNLMGQLGLSEGDSISIEFVDPTKEAGLGAGIYNQQTQNQTSAQPANSNAPSTGSAPAANPGNPGAAPFYQNPMRALQTSSGFSPERVDQGVDYAGQGPIYAAGPGIVNQSSSSAGWPGGGFVSYQLTTGPFAGRSIYIAENITPQVSVGQTVDSNTVIAIQHLGSPNDETGWATGNTTEALAAHYGGYNNNNPTMLGLDFNNFLTSLGCPSGTGADKPPMGTLPNPWPLSTGGPPTGNGAAGAAPAQQLITEWTYGGQGPDPISGVLSGTRSLMNNAPILPFIDMLCKTSMRSWCAAPNGDFIAWFPDYFGAYGTSGIMDVANIELQDFTIVWSDESLVTHQYTAGTWTPSLYGSQPGGPVVASNLVSTMGIATVDFPQILEALFGLPPSSDSNNDPVSQLILDRFGIRPNLSPMQTLTSPEAEFYYALYLFQQNWSAQFSARVPITFMPELYPGMLMRMKQYGVQAYVTGVTHSFNFTQGGGFQTDVDIMAPSTTDSSNVNAGRLFGLPKGGLSALI